MSLAARIAAEGKADRELSRALRRYQSCEPDAGTALWNLLAAEHARGVRRSHGFKRSEATTLAGLVDAHGALTAYRLFSAGKNA